MPSRTWCASLLVSILAALLPLGGASGVEPVEPYADYQPATHCSSRAKVGTVVLGHYLVRRYGGGFGSISRHCGRRRDVTSEHQEGRAFDWSLDARRARDRRSAQSFLRDILASDRAGNPHARARRMGIMYVIWNDRMWAAWDEFRPEPYLSSSCRTRKRCSPTLRHRDHLHVSLTRRGAQARTSWFVARHAAAVSS